MSTETTNTNEAAPKKNFIKGLKAEFGRIIWPEKDKVKKETVAVLVTTLVLALIIAGMDSLIQLGLEAIL